FDRAVIAQLREIISAKKPEIIQTHNVKSHFLIRLSGLAQGRRWIAFQHGYTAPDFKMRCYNQLDRWSLRAADRVIAVCKPFAARLKDRGVDPARLLVLHNSIAQAPDSKPEEVRDLRERLKLTSDARVLLSIGRL